MGTSRWRHCDSIIPVQEVQRHPQVCCQQDPTASMFPWHPYVKCEHPKKFGQHVLTCAHVFCLIMALIISVLHSVRSAGTFQYQTWRARITLILWFLWQNCVSEDYAPLMEGNEIPTGHCSKSLLLPLIFPINLSPAPLLHSSSQDPPRSSCLRLSFILWPAQQAPTLHGLL